LSFEPDCALHHMWLPFYISLHFPISTYFSSQVALLRSLAVSRQGVRSHPLRPPPRPGPTLPPLPGPDPNPDPGDHTPSSAPSSPASSHGAQSLVFFGDRHNVMIVNLMILIKKHSLVCPMEHLPPPLDNQSGTLFFYAKRLRNANMSF